MSGTPRRIAAQRSARIGGQALDLGSSVLEQVAEADRAEYLRRRAELAPLPPVAERSDMAEAPWQKQVTQVAVRLGLYVYHPKLSRWSARGWPDLSLLGSRAAWIECKADDGQLTPAQVEVITRMRACGLTVEVFRPWHGLQAVADYLQRTQEAPR